MSSPIWSSFDKHDEKLSQKSEKRRRRAKFVVEYDLAYDGGGSNWTGYYKTYWGARAAAFWNLHVSSWGGSAKVYPYLPQLPVGPQHRQRKKGLFRGR